MHLVKKQISTSNFHGICVLSFFSFFNLRRILDIWWPRRISNNALHTKTNQKDINVQIKEKKYRWIGHTLRKDKGEICYKALLWNPQGKRKVGAPKRTWRNSIKRECGGKYIAELTHLANVDKDKIGHHRKLGKCLPKKFVVHLRKISNICIKILYGIKNIYIYTFCYINILDLTASYLI